MKKLKCGYCSKEMLDDNLKQHCKEVHGKSKLVKGQMTWTFRKTRKTSRPPPPPKKGKSDNEEKCCLVLFN